MGAGQGLEKRRLGILRKGIETGGVGGVRWVLYCGGWIAGLLFLKPRVFGFGYDGAKIILGGFGGGESGERGLRWSMGWG